MPKIMHRLPADTPLRIVRLLLAIWLLVSPFLLGYAWTFPQREHTLAGLLLLPVLALGLVVPGMRVALLIVGPWLMFSPYFSGWYGDSDAAIWNARIAGLLATMLGLLAIPEREHVVEPEPRTAGEERRFGLAPRPGWTGLWRRRLPAR